MVPTASPERPAEMNAVICIFNIDNEGFNGVSSIKTDIYFVHGFVLLAGELIRPVPTWIDRSKGQVHC